MKVLSLLANSLLIVLLLTCCQLIMANDISMTLSAVASETEKKEEAKYEEEQAKYDGKTARTKIRRREAETTEA